MLFIIIAAFFLLWLSVFDGLDVIEEKNSIPEKPNGTYTGFYYENLGDTEKIAYELIVAEIEQMPLKIRIPYLDDEGLSRVFEALLYENPEYFFLSEKCKLETTAFGKSYFLPQYIITLSEYAERLDKLEKIKEIIDIKTHGISDDFEKEQIIHDYIIEKCEYVKKTGGDYSSAYGCLVNGSASCEGYAKAMKYLLDEADVENYIAAGNTTDENGASQGHAWNIVRIDGEYYHVDVTWDDPIESSVENKYAYFNITDEEISATHDAEKRFLGKCTDTENNYYVNNEIYFTAFDSTARNAIISEIVKQANKKNDVASFKLADGKLLDEAEKELFDQEGIYSILSSANILSSENLLTDKVAYAVDESHNIIVITDFLC